MAAPNKRYWLTLLKPLTARFLAAARMEIAGKQSVSHQSLICMTALMAFLCVAGCIGTETKKTSRDPLEGWKCRNARLNPPNLQNYRNYPNSWYYSPDQIYHIDEAILADYQNFIDQLKRKNPTLYVAEIYFYEGPVEQHAVKLVIEERLREYEEYFLLYDKSNVRTQVIKGRKWHQFHI